MTNETGAGELVRAVCRAWEDLDAGALEPLFTEDGVYDDPLKDGRLTGPRTIREGNAEAMAQLRSCRIDLTHVVEQGTTALAEGRFLSEMTDGRRLDFDFAVVAEAAGGRLRRFAEYFDTRPLLA